MQKVNLSEKLALFSDHWSPKIVGELNGQQVKLVKFQGEFVWHKHDHEDELFLVVKGRFRMEFRDRHIWLEEGEFLIVPRGVEHRRWVTNPDVWTGILRHCPQPEPHVRGCWVIDTLFVKK
jgi:mannose-6-phosphate isomerase-like protein (cupin superfamily)